MKVGNQALCKLILAICSSHCRAQVKSNKSYKAIIFSLIAFVLFLGSLSSGAAALTLGSITVGGSCSLTSGLNNSSCQTITVTGCPNLSNGTANIITAQPPVGTPVIGTIIFGSGLGGTGLYGAVGSNEAAMMENLRKAGYRIVERVWTNSWFTGTLGPAVSACRYATLANWIKTQYPTGQLCATGVSGGAVELSFGLSRWNLGNILNAVVFDSGPQTRLDYYCVGTSNPAWNSSCLNINSSYPFQCGGGTAGCEPYSGVAQLIDQSYNGVNTCNGATMQSPNLTKLYNDSADGPGALLNFPNTKVAFYEGAQDCTFGVATSGVAYANEITSLGSTPTVSVIAGLQHQISQTAAGAAIIQNALTNLCTGASATTVVVTASAGANGSLACASPVVLNSATTCTATPNSGYHTSSINGCNGTWNGGNSYTTGAITSPCTVSSTFAVNQYLVSTSSSAGGTISPASVLVSHGSTTTFTVTPNTGYTALVGGTCGGNLAGSTYTTNAITGPCTVSATFTLIKYSVTTNAGPGGTISPSSALVSYGSTTTFQVTPSAGNHAMVSGCSGTLAGTIYTTGPISGNCIITATFGNKAPAIPSVKAPASGSEVSTQKPTLMLNAVIDPDGDPVTYVFQVYADSGLSTMVTSTATPRISWSIASTLNDNTLYYWRAQATDGYLNSSWMATANFFVNTANNPPTVPGINAPAGLSSLTPVLSVTNAADVDIYDTVTYDFSVASDAVFSNVVAGVVSLPQGTTGTTSWTVSPTLVDNKTYYWRARSRDNHGSVSAWANGAFFVNTANDAPTAPVIISPSGGNTVVTSQPVLTIQNATDPDHDILHYAFEIDTVNTFNSANKQTSGLIAEGSVNTSWTPAALTEDATYFWRVKANDGTIDGPWSAPGSFFVNTVNNPPATPTLNNPSNNGQVTVLTPTLKVNASTDPDNDPITYDYEVYSDSGLTTLVTSTSGIGTGWTLPQPLLDNTWYWWRSLARDNHGATSSWMVASSFMVNNNGYNDPPSIVVTSPGVSDPPTNALQFTIGWSAADPDSDPVITLFYDQAGSGYAGSQIPTGTIHMSSASSYAWDISGLADGTYYVYATIYDGSTTTKAYAAGSLTIDRSGGPIALITGAPTGTTSSTQATLVISGAGVVEYRYRLDQGNWSLTTPVATVIALTLLNDAPHTVEVQGRNASGTWQGSVTSKSWTVDTTAPDATITSAPPNPSLVSSATFSFTATEPAVFECSLDGAAFTACSSPYFYASLLSGSHTFQVRGIDAAGNIDQTPAAYTWTVNKDTRPDAFSFPAVTNAPLNRPFISSPIMVSGINATAGISIIGGSYSINNGPFVAVAGSVKAGAKIRVQVLSSSAFSTSKTAVLTIGGEKGSFTVTTLAKDTTPDSFGFADKGGAMPNTWVISDPVTITGINSAATISISGGIYSVNNGAFTGAKGTVRNNSLVRVKVKSSINYNTSKTASVAVGGAHGSFTVTTVPVTVSGASSAVDNAGLVMTGDWYGEDVIWYSGGSAAQSNRIGNSQSSYLETTANGPFTISFFQKVSSQTWYDTLKFSIDSKVKSSISGEVNWQKRTFTVSTPGTHTLRWTFSKNGSVSQGIDAAWIDKVVITP
jgi:hypothetical protein